MYRLLLQRGLLEVLYDIFRLPLPVVTEEFIEALLSVGKRSSALNLFICCDYTVICLIGSKIPEQ